jgi:hypothetical protein
LVADLPRVAAILHRIAADVDELARARRVADLGAAAAGPDGRAERRRRVAVAESIRAPPRLMPDMQHAGKWWGG